MGLFRSKAGKNPEMPVAEFPQVQAEPVKAEPKVAPRNPKYEARPDPDKAGWGLTVGQEIFKAREGRASQE